MSSLPLLIELGTEELPPKALPELAAAFREGVVAAFDKAGITHEGAEALWSPRRLAIRFDAVATRQPDQQLERRGPAVNAGFDASGAPTKALSSFAASCGVEVAQLDKLETDKGAWFVYRATKAGADTATLIPAIIEASLKALPVPKPMRWGDRDTLFVRPVHWLVMLFGNDVIEGQVLGLRAARQSRGHRFHCPQHIDIATPDSYVEALRAAHVLVDFDERRDRVRREVEAAAKRAGGTARIPEALLDEVANITEWPVAIECAFERDFLRVPQEALITTMESNQKFFPVLDAAGKLTEHFVGVANIESRDPAEIRKGYERVIRPRFADARFFYDDDLKSPLASHQKSLESVTYQQKLGTTWDKVARVAELARQIAPRLGVDAALATRAAALSKCDLMTRMVGEFPELQGTMGRYYATAQNENAEVARALDEFYAPRFAGDRIAEGKVAQVLAIAEKADTIAGLFAIGQKPTGNKDPFSLRRNALGLARTLVEGQLDLDLRALFVDALDRVQSCVEEVANRTPQSPPPGAKGGKPQQPMAIDREALADELYDFVLERLRGYYAEQGVRGDVFDAVAAVRPASLADFDRRLKAIVEFAKLDEAASLAAANKRIGNIIRQAREKQFIAGTSFAPVDQALLSDGEERTLAAAVSGVSGEVDSAIASRNYVGAMRQLAGLRPAVDAYFDKVMVMVDDAAVRANRLAMLGALRERFLAVADIGVLQAG